MKQSFSLLLSLRQNQERPDENRRRNKFFYRAICSSKNNSCKVINLYENKLIKKIIIIFFGMFCKSFFNSTPKHGKFTFCKIFYNGNCLPGLFFSKASFTF